MIVAIEGGDACGKATQTKLLAEKLGGTRFAFPDYETPTGKAILGHLKKHWSVANPCDDPDCKHRSREVEHFHELQNNIDPLVFQCLQTVNRLELLPTIRLAQAVRPLVFDRYWASALVYGVLDGLDPKWIELIQAPLPQPDAWVLIDVPVEEGFTRRPERRDRIESNRPYLEKVRVAYLRLFEERRLRRAVGAEGSAWHVINGLGTVEEVHARICTALAPRVER